MNAMLSVSVATEKLLNGGGAAAGAGELHEATAMSGEASRLSPERRALAAHLEAIARAETDLEQKLKPAERLRRQLAAANAEVESLERELAAVDVRYVEVLVEAAQSGDKIAVRPPPASKTELAIESARRTVGALQIALHECQTIADAAVITLRDLRMQSDQFVLPVLQREFKDALERRETALAAFAANDLKAIGLARLFSMYGREPGLGSYNMAWISAGSAATESYDNARAPELGPSPAAVFAATERWRAVLARLLTDPTAASG